MICFDEQSFSFEYNPNYPWSFFFFFCRGRVPFLVSCDQVILYTWKCEVCEWKSPRWMTALVIANLHFLPQPETEIKNLLNHASFTY